MKRLVFFITALLVAVGLVVAAVSATGGDEGAGSLQPPTEEDFVPSEELPADSAISFPVDI